MKTNKTLFFLVTLILFFGTQLNAQDRNSPVLSYDLNVMDYAGAGIRQIPMQISRSQLGLTFGHSTGNGRWEWSHSVSYTHHDKGFKGLFDREEEFIVHGHIYSYGIDAVYALSDRWNIHADFIPQVRSYLEEHGNHFYMDFQGGLLFEYKVGANLSLGAGYGYSRNLSEGMVHPVLLVEWTNQQNVHARFYFPEVAEIWYSVYDRLRIGLHATLTGDEFLGKEETYGQSGTSIQYADFTVGPAATYRISNAVTLNLGISYTAGRHLVIEGDQFRERLHPAKTAAVQGGIQVRFP